MQCLEERCFAMGINKFNAEGYYDPTCYEALSKVEREEKQATYQPMCVPHSPGMWNITRSRQESTADLHLRTRRFRLLHIYCFHSFWMTRIPKREKRLCILTMCFWGNARRFGCSEALSQRAWSMKYV